MTHWGKSLLFRTFFPLVRAPLLSMNVCNKYYYYQTNTIIVLLEDSLSLTLSVGWSGSQEQKVVPSVSSSHSGARN